VKRSTGMLRIGDLRVDPALDEICKGGSTIKVEPRTMRLFICLAEHAGEVVSVETLLAEVWKDVIVGPDSVYQAVAGLRRILNDDPKAPAYIANVVRRGYRLVAPVAPWSDGPVGGGGSPPTVDPARGIESVRGLEARRGVEVPRVEGTDPPATDSGQSGTVQLRSWLIAAAIVLAVGMAAFLSQRGLRSPHLAPPAVAGKSVAVLPFLDLSEKKDEEYFADGMSEELIDVLARVPELRVPARTSSFYFKGKQATVADIAKALGVENVLEGSVRKSGDMLRVTAQLIRVDTGYHVWSQTFERPTADVFKVQDEIAAAVAQALKLSLLSSDAAKTPPTANTEAYTLYLKANELDRYGGTESYEAAKKYLEQALALDPEFAEGWADLAYLLTENLETLDTRRPPELCARAHHAADEALRLDPHLSVAHAAKAQILMLCDWNWVAADAEYRRALDLDPGNAWVLRGYANFEWSILHPSRALELAQKAVARDPLNEWDFMSLAFAQGANGQLKEAEASYRRALELNPMTGHGLLALALLAQGKTREALVELEKESNEQVRAMNYPFIYDALGRKDDADRAIASFIAKYAEKDPENIGAFYACRNNADLAIEWLRRAVAIHEIFDEVPPRLQCLDNLNPDPRYQALLREINMPK
jgi:TolB-like protein/DNA-binding winged helix-turn-helix (wHTH) protein